jgi:hypothetical protein
MNSIVSDLSTALNHLMAYSKIKPTSDGRYVCSVEATREWIERAMLGRPMSNDQWRNLRLFAGFIAVKMKLCDTRTKQDFFARLPIQYAEIYKTITSDDIHPLQKRVRQSAQYPESVERVGLYCNDQVALVAVVRWLQEYDRRVPTRNWISTRLIIQEQTEGSLDDEKFVAYRSVNPGPRSWKWHSDRRLFVHAGEIRKYLQELYSGNVPEPSWLIQALPSSENKYRRYSLNEFLNLVAQVEASTFEWKRFKDAHLANWLRSVMLDRDRILPGFEQKFAEVE